MTQWMSDAWDNWERLRQDPAADPIEVLRAVSAFQKYFGAIEKEAVKVAPITEPHMA
jgi:hypothetical protein